MGAASTADRAIASKPDIAFADACDTLRKSRAEVYAFPTDVAHEDAFHEAVMRMDRAALALAAMQAPTPADLRTQAQLIITHSSKDDVEPAFVMLRQLAGNASVPAVNPDADYIALCNQVVQSEAEWRATGRHQDSLPEAEQREYEQTVREAISDRSSELFDRLLQLTPRTPEGQKAAARMLLAFMPCHDDGTPNIEINHIGENVAWMLVKQLTGVAIPVPPNPDADLKAACTELIALIDRMNVEAGDKDITNDDPRYVQQEGLAERILAQVPRTLDGHQLRAQAILAWHGGMDGNGRPASELHQDDFWQVIRDLIGASTIEAMSKRTAVICAGYPDAVPV